MGQAPLDLPDPLHARPLATAGAADDLLSQMAGEEIDRLLAEAEQANDGAVEDREAAEAEPVTTLPAKGNEPQQRSIEPASPERLADPSMMAPLDPEGARRGTAVSAFVAEGDPALEAELDNLLANLSGAPAALSDSGIGAPPRGKQAPEGAEGAESEASAARVPAPEPQSAAAAEGQTTGDKVPPTKDQAAPAAETDPVVAKELDQVFDKMTAAAGPAPVIDSPATNEPATPAGSIDLLQVLDPIVARDAAIAGEAAAAQTQSDGTRDEEAPAEDRAPIYVMVLEWVNAPLAWLPPAVRDAAGKIGILTLINAAAVLLFVLFFRRK